MDTVLEKIQKWDLSQIERKLVEKHGHSVDHAAQLIEEYRRFIALISLYPERSFVPGHIVDQVWHEHILCTRDYAAMCDVVAGRFIHHQPTTDMTVLVPEYEGTNSLYEEVFGEQPDTEFWPVAGDMTCDSNAKVGLTCDSNITAELTCDSNAKAEMTCDSNLAEVPAYN